MGKVKNISTDNASYVVADVSSLHGMLLVDVNNHLKRFSDFQSQFIAEVANHDVKQSM